MANLLTLIKATEKQVRKLINKELVANGYTPILGSEFIYAEGTIPVLLVAHYDTVLETQPRFINCKDGVLSAKKGLGADDRAGVYALLELSKKHHCHLLFTGGEEVGCIGARAFTKSGIKPEVNYVIELDRRGTNDAIYYDGESEEFTAFIDSFGWKTAHGSCTDICTLCPYLDVMGVNLSIGYENEHRSTETLDTAVMNKNIARVAKMFDGKRFEWHESVFDDWSWYWGHNFGYEYDDGDGDLWCVEYIDDDGETKHTYVAGWSELEAIGAFLMHEQWLSYANILDVELAYEDRVLIEKGETNETSK